MKTLITIVICFVATTAAHADPDGDGLNNLMEYALGGNPSYADASQVEPTFTTHEDGETNWVYVVHHQRVDDPSLTHTVTTKTNLMSADTGNTNDSSYLGESYVVEGMKTMQHRTEMKTPVKFVFLTVENR